MSVGPVGNRIYPVTRSDLVVEPVQKGQAGDFDMGHEHFKQRREEEAGYRRGAQAKSQAKPPLDLKSERLTSVQRLEEIDSVSFSTKRTAQQRAEFPLAPGVAELISALPQEPAPRGLGRLLKSISFAKGATGPGSENEILRYAEVNLVPGTEQRIYYAAAGGSTVQELLKIIKEGAAGAHDPRKYVGQAALWVPESAVLRLNKLDQKEADMLVYAAGTLALIKDHEAIRRHNGPGRRS